MQENEMEVDTDDHPVPLWKEFSYWFYEPTSRWDSKNYNLSEWEIYLQEIASEF
jgi:hypothetical protein